MLFSISHTSNLTHFQSHIIQISHTSNLTLFQSHTLPISHSSNLAFFQSHTLSISHSFRFTLIQSYTQLRLPFENLFCAICMGGVFDVIQETFYGKPKTSEENGDAAKPKSGDGSCNSFYSHSPLCPVSRDNVTLLQNKLLTAIVEQS